MLIVKMEAYYTKLNGMARNGTHGTFAPSCIVDRENAKASCISADTRFYLLSTGFYLASIVLWNRCPSEVVFRAGHESLGKESVRSFTGLLN